MNVELHQLDLRYEKLRTHKPEAERKLVGSLAEIGQQVPVVVVHAEGPDQFVLVDGYKRVRALRRLGQDLVGATCWDLSQAEALVLDRLMRTGEGATALEQGWLLQELYVRFALSLEDLGRRFARSASWVPAAGAGGGVAGGDPGACAARRAAGPCGHETPGPLGPRQRRRL